MSPITVVDIERALFSRFPAERAESWDRVGLLAGDPQAMVKGVTVALDATLESVAAAVEAGSNVLVTHHPAFLEPPQTVRPGSGAAGVVYASLTASVSLINAHTNLDRDAQAQRLLPQMLELTPAEPLERATMAMTVVTAYVPSEFASRVVDAMATAGAGRIGDYERCSFAAQGTGSFTPSDASKPFSGSTVQPSSVSEQRVEMVCPAGRARAVVAAAVAAHPYEEPLVTTVPVEMARNAAALGMVCEPVPGKTLQQLVEFAAQVFEAPPRVWGEPGAQAGVVATTTGSAGSMIPAALSVGASTLVCGEVRYHDALDARAAGLSIVELGHDVSEWPLVGLLAETIRSIPGIDGVDVVPLQPRRGWWSP
jgi:putative NIF3 family GTP cyclohydrolase 1 type 2